MIMQLLVSQALGNHSSWSYWRLYFSLVDMSYQMRISGH